MSYDFKGYYKDPFEPSVTLASAGLQSNDLRTARQTHPRQSSIDHSRPDLSLQISDPTLTSALLAANIPTQHVHRVFPETTVQTRRSPEHGGATEQMSIPSDHVPYFSTKFITDASSTHTSQNPPDEGPNPSPTTTEATGTKQKLRADARHRQPPRPPNPWILFRSARCAALKGSKVLLNGSELTKLIRSEWQSLSPAERKEWADKAVAAKEEHKERYPAYRYQPKRKEKDGTEDAEYSTPSKRRKTRHEAVLDLATAEWRAEKSRAKVEKVAELLRTGQSNEDLNAAVQEWEKEYDVLYPPVLDEENILQPVVRSTAGTIAQRKQKRSSRAKVRKSAQSKQSPIQAATVSSPTESLNSIMSCDSETVNPFPIHSDTT
jgi:hypothetical protein